MNSEQSNCQTVGPIRRKPVQSDKISKIFDRVSSRFETIILSTNRKGPTVLVLVKQRLFRYLTKCSVGQIHVEFSMGMHGNDTFFCVFFF